jgi:hypothetical protein
VPEARSVIWELYKGADRLTCELRNHGNHGVEIVLLRNNAWLHSQIFADEIRARNQAEKDRRTAEQEGWS